MPNEEFRKFVEGALRKYVPAEYLKEDALADLLTRVTYAPFEAGDGSAKGTEALQKALAGNNRILYFMATSPKLYGPTCLSLARRGSRLRALPRRSREAHRPGLCRRASRSTKPWAASSTKTASSASITTSAKRRCRTCSRCASRTRCSSRCGMPRPSTTCRSPSRRPSASKGAWGYYDEAGALRDMVQNHMLQLVALVAMEPPHLFEPNEVRNEKTKVMRSLRPITAATVAANTVRGQYAAGSAGGVAVPGYNQETGRQGQQRHGNLRRAARGDRQLALGGRAVLPAHRQAHAIAPHRHRHPVQVRAAQHLRGRRTEPAGQPPGHPPAAARKA